MAEKWWLLLVLIGTGQTEIPAMYGPYPSEALCVSVARVIMPANRQFWTVEERKADALVKDAHALEIQQRRLLPGLHTLKDGTRIAIDERGKVIVTEETSPPYFVKPKLPTYAPLAPCLQWNVVR